MFPSHSIERLWPNIVWASELQILFNKNKVNDVDVARVGLNHSNGDPVQYSEIYPSVSVYPSALYSDTVELVVSIQDANDNIPVFSPLTYVGGRLACAV